MQILQAFFLLDMKSMFDEVGVPHFKSVAHVIGLHRFFYIF